MSITVYDGLQGAGKTYEVVAGPVLNGIKSGRRIVTNIRGMDDEEMREYLMEQGCEESSLGHIVTVTNDQVEDGLFFPQFSNKEETEFRDDTFCRPGDLVVIDEVWRFWELAAGIPKNHMLFFRQHRHMVDAKGVSCDLVMITQNWMDVAAKLRRVIKERYTMSKKTALAFRIGKFEYGQKQYIVQVFVPPFAKKPLYTLDKTYDKRLYSMYLSYATKEGGKEAKVDGRGSIFNSWYFRLLVPAALGVFALSAYALYGFFSGDAQLLNKGGEVAQEAVSDDVPDLPRGRLTDMKTVTGNPDPSKPCKTCEKLDFPTEAKLGVPGERGNGRPFFAGGLEDVEQAKASEWRLLGREESGGVSRYWLGKGGQVRVLEGAQTVVQRNGELFLMVDGERISWHTGTSFGSMLSAPLSR